MLPTGFNPAHVQIGQKRTSGSLITMSAFPPNADMDR